MTDDVEKNPHRDPSDADADVPPTDPAHRAALAVMVASPVVLGAVVYLLLRLLSG